MTVHPFVVAWNDHERVPELLELAFPRLEPLVGAGTLAAGDVADVDDEGEVLAIDLLDHRIERRRLGRVVGRVADQGECEAGADGRWEGTRKVRRAAGERKQQDEEQPFHSRFSL